MEKIVMTKARKYLVIGVSLLAAVGFAIVALIIVPMHEKAISIKADLRTAEKEVAAIKEGYGKGKSASEAVKSIMSEIRRLEARFPKKEEVILKDLSDFASKNGVEVISMKPKKTDVADIGGVVINLEDVSVQRMSIAMTARAPYKKLGDFIISLYEKFPAYVTVDSIRMKSPANAKTPWILDAEIELTSYLLSQKKPAA